MKHRSYLALEGIGVTFPTPKGPFTALRDIDLSIEKGEFVALIGHSGCGKSTLLNLVAGLLPATEGVLLTVLMLVGIHVALRLMLAARAPG